MKNFIKFMLICSFAFLNLQIINADFDSLSERVYNLPPNSEEDITYQISNYISSYLDDNQFLLLHYEKQFLSNGVISPQDQYQELLGSTTEIKNIGYAKNQYPQGVVLSNGGTIYYSDSKGNDVNVSFSIGAYKTSVGIGLGSKSEGVTGYSLYCNPGVACKIYIRKKVEISLYKVTVFYQGQTLSVQNVPVKNELQLYLSNG